MSDYFPIIPDIYEDHTASALDPGMLEQSSVDLNACKTACVLYTSSCDDILGKPPYGQVTVEAPHFETVKRHDAIGQY